ncbi:TPA: hypothetical protein ACSCYS_004230 [Aeromonas veronii]
MSTASSLRYFIHKSGAVYIVGECFDHGSTAPHNFHLRVEGQEVIVNLDGCEPERYPLLDTLHEVAAIVDATYPDVDGVFIDTDSVYYLVFDAKSGRTNAPYHVIIEGSNVMECGAYSKGDGYPIEGEYTLHPSMTAIANLE